MGRRNFYIDQIDAIEKEAVEWEIAEIIDHEVLHISKDKSH